MTYFRPQTYLLAQSTIHLVFIRQHHGKSSFRLKQLEKELSLNTSLWSRVWLHLSFPDGSVGKESTYHAGSTEDMSSVPGSGRSSGGGNDNPLQCSFLKNALDRGAWQPTVHRVAKSWMWLSNWATETHNHRVMELQHIFLGFMEDDVQESQVFAPCLGTVSDHAIGGFCLFFSSWACLILLYMLV